MKKRLIPLVALALLGGAVTSCGGETSKPVVETKNIYAISYNLADPNMSSLWKEGLETASVELGFNKISLADAKNKDEEAVNMVETAGKENYDAYLINVVNQTNGKQYLNKVKDTNKPVVFWNREVETAVLKSYEKAYYVGIESAEGGRYQGAMAAEYINKAGFDTIDRNHDGKLGVIVVRGEKSHADAEARTQFSPAYLERGLTGGNPTAELKKKDSGYEVDTAKGAWNKVEVKAIVDGTDLGGNGWDPVTAANEVARTLSKEGDKIDLVLSNNDGMALGIVADSNFKASGCPIWGVDALADALTEINKADSQLKGTVQNDGKAQAKVCVQVAKNLKEGKGFADGIKTVATKEAWEKDGLAVWSDTATKSLRVHHAKIVKTA
ncbi:MAG: substrate-binding domain-containing protein [Bacilli bacterium]